MDPLTDMLLAWYEKRRRDLPWRRNRDPYRIWISETMLQQTQVKTVLPYFERFIERFPTVDALATAHIDEVLALWSGLGYYQRARRMHHAAIEISAGSFPRSSQELLQLPGIGPYTAAAVASIAFGEVVPVLDGNVERVLSRYLAQLEDPKRRSQRDILLAQATEFLDRDCPGDSNQALMELGATVCLPLNPRCGSCPLKAGCLGLQGGNPERFPPPRRRRQMEKVAWSVMIVESEGRNLFIRRPVSSGVLPGMWELPSVPTGQDRESIKSSLTASYGGLWQLDDEIFQVKHSITYRSLTLHAHPARIVGSLNEHREVAWIGQSARREYGVSSMYEKVLSRWSDAQMALFS